MVIILGLGIMTPLITGMSFTDDLAKIKTTIHEINNILGKNELKRPEKMIHKILNSDISLKM